MKKSTENKRINTCKEPKKNNNKKIWRILSKRIWRKKNVMRATAWGLSMWNLYFSCIFVCSCIVFDLFFSSRKRSFLLPMSVTPFQMGNTDWNIQNVTSVKTFNIFDFFFNDKRNVFPNKKIMKIVWDWCQVVVFSFLSTSNNWKQWFYQLKIIRKQMTICRCMRWFLFVFIGNKFYYNGEWKKGKHIKNQRMWNDLMESFETRWIGIQWNWSGISIKFRQIHFVMLKFDLNKCYWLQLNMNI